MRSPTSDKIGEHQNGALRDIRRRARRNLALAACIHVGVVVSLQLVGTRGSLFIPLVAAQEYTLYPNHEPSLVRQQLEQLLLKDATGSLVSNNINDTESETSGNGDQDVKHPGPSHPEDVVGRHPGQQLYCIRQGYMVGSEGTNLVDDECSWKSTENEKKSGKARRRRRRRPRQAVADKSVTVSHPADSSTSEEGSSAVQKTQKSAEEGSKTKAGKARRRRRRNPHRGGHRMRKRRNNRRQRRKQQTTTTVGQKEPDNADEQGTTKTSRQEEVDNAEEQGTIKTSRQKEDDNAEEQETTKTSHQKEGDNAEEQ